MKPSHIVITSGILAAGLAATWFVMRDRHTESGTPAPLIKEDAARWAPLFDSSVLIAERHALARTVDASLPLSAVEKWAANLPQGDTSQHVENHFVVWNEIVEQSRLRNLHPASLTVFLLSSLRNASLAPSLRDYSVQHLALWVAPGSSGQHGEQDAARRAEAIAALCMIAGDESVRYQTIPGTALLALSDMEAGRSADLTQHWPVLDASLARLISAEDTPTTLRLAAIQAAGAARRRAHAPAIRHILSGESTDESVFISSIAALGEIGGVEDRPILKVIQASGSLASQAAAAALKRLPL